MNGSAETNWEIKPDSSGRTLIQYYRIPAILLVLVFVLSSLFGWNQHPPEDGKRDWFAIAIGTLHLALPLSVLVVEFFALAMMRRETTERRRHEQRMLDQQTEMRKTQEALQRFQGSIGRENYMARISSGIESARQEVLFTTATMEATWQSDQQRKIVEAVHRREALVEPSSPSTRAYEHRGLVANRPGALVGALELMRNTNVECRMSSVLCMTRLRFVVIDREECVLGVASGEPALAAERPTESSFRVLSSMLGNALADRFELLWENSVSPFECLDELIEEAKKSCPEYSRIDVRRWISAEKCGIDDQWLCDRSDAYKQLPSPDPAEPEARLAKVTAEDDRSDPEVPNDDGA